MILLIGIFDFFFICKIINIIAITMAIEKNCIRKVTLFKSNQILHHLQKSPYLLWAENYTIFLLSDFVVILKIGEKIN